MSESKTPDSKARRRCYTVAAANELLPRVRELLADLRQSVGEFDELRAELTSSDGTLARPEPDTPVNPGHLRSVLMFHSSLSRFHDLGLDLKDVQRGLVDFPARHHDKDILLCWQDGEDSVGWYHDPETGFAGRQEVGPIADELEPASQPTADKDEDPDEPT